MKQFLNEMFANKGLEFLDIIITEVTLPEEIKLPLDLKAQFGSLNEMEREKYNFEMKKIDDQEDRYQRATITVFDHGLKAASQ